MYVFPQYFISSVYLRVNTPTPRPTVFAVPAPPSGDTTESYASIWVGIDGVSEADIPDDNLPVIQAGMNIAAL
jgi:hypothetical protein